METPMSSEQMQSAIKELQDTVIVMAHIENMKSFNGGSRRTWRRLPRS
jgi:hypothetical protein